MSDRTPADFSREFAGYMADAAERYCAVINAYHRKLIEAGVEIERHGDNELTEAYTGLFGAIYEWRKRESRALSADHSSDCFCIDCQGANAPSVLE